MKTTILILAALIGVSKVKAQTNPLLNQYFNNTYLANPAMAGLAGGATADLTFRSQWNNIPGAPMVQNLSATYGWEKVGVGLNMNLDKAGLQSDEFLCVFHAHHGLCVSSRLCQSGTASSEVEFNQFFNASEGLV